MNCQHDYCPHLHFKKCMLERLQNVPYTIFPDGTIDSFTNVPIKCTKLYKSNVPTTAYERYTLTHGSNDDDRNFVRDYYLNKEANTKSMLNTIVQELEEDMAKNSAYVLADSQSQKYQEFAKNKSLAMQNARHRAISRYNDHFKTVNRKKEIDQQENQKWLKKLYRKLEEVARHIVEGEGENLGERQRQFLLSKTNLTAAYLSQIKVKNPKVAFDMLEEIRVLMLKKKLRFEEQREQQQQNKSVSMSFGSESGSQSMTQNSMLSEATSLNQSNMFGEDQVVDKYCNFEALKKKWRLDDVEEVRQMIRRVLTKQIVFQAEIDAVKKRKEEDKINERLRKKSQSKKKQNLNKTQQKKKTPKRAATMEKKTKKTEESTYLPSHKMILSKDEQKTKDQLVEGGQFDAIGEIYHRNRNFSEMFRKRQDENMIEFSFKEKDRTLSFNNTKDCCCSTQA